MELNINSPAYFSDQYGVDDEVYRYCRSLYAFFKDKEYSKTLSVIGITPVIAPPKNCMSRGCGKNIQRSYLWERARSSVSDWISKVITRRTAVGK